MKAANPPGVSPSCRWTELDPGEVVIRAHYSGVNYKDALAATGAGKVIRRFPCVGGIDVSGVVESSSDARFKAGRLSAGHRLRHGRGARRRLCRICARAGRLGGAAAVEPDIVRSDGAGYGWIHRGARHSSAGAERIDAEKRQGHRHRCHRRRRQRWRSRCCRNSATTSWH